jgi:hypothetical protein
MKDEWRNRTTRREVAALGGEEEQKSRAIRLNQKVPAAGVIAGSSSISEGSERKDSTDESSGHFVRDFGAVLLPLVLLCRPFIFSVQLSVAAHLIGCHNMNSQQHFYHPQ